VKFITYSNWVHIWIYYTLKRVSFLRK